MQTLKELHLYNYRNLRIPDGISFDPLTIFVGPNGYGKTNVIKTLRFLQDACIGTVDERRGVTRFEAAVAKWGGSNVLDAKLTQPGILTVEIKGESEPDNLLIFSLGMTVVDNRVQVRFENMSVRFSGEDRLLSTLYEAKMDEGQAWVFSGPEDESPISVSTENLQANDLMVRGLKRFLPGSHESSVPPRATINISEYLFEDVVDEWTFYDASQMSLDSIRQARQETGQGDTILTPTGENLPLVLFNLCSKDIDFQERILRAMQELFPDTRAFRPNVIGRVALTVEWFRKDIKRPFYLDEMSDGTIRMLCWATVLLSPELPSLIVLDEPEASIHPAWLQILAGWIREAARKTQVIVSTHSSDLLDYFTEDAASVRVFGRDVENPTYATVRALDPAKVADKFAEGWKLGDLYRVGDPEVGGWPW